MKRKHREYKDALHEALRDHEEAVAYLNAALLDEDQRVFLLALKDVLTAQNIDITAFAGEAQVSRQNIYRMLSVNGNPRWINLSSLIHAMGYHMKLTKQKIKPVAKKQDSSLPEMSCQKPGK